MRRFTSTYHPPHAHHASSYVDATRLDASTYRARRTPCELDPAAFDFDGSTTADEAYQLRALCRICAELDPCRDHALTHDVAGFAAGLTERERRRLGAVAGGREPVRGVA